MKQYVICCIAILGCYLNGVYGDCKGCVSFDEYSFTKIVPNFKVVLIKYDAAYPYGDKHDTYVKFAEEHISNRQFLIGEVGVKDYGDNENRDFAMKQGVNVSNLPAIKLYLGGAEKSVEFDGTKTISVDNLRKFVMDNTDMHLVLPGCVEELDMLAIRFMKNVKNKELIDEAGTVASKLKGDDAEAGKSYVAYMTKIYDTGVKFVQNEMNRLNKILKDGKIALKKKQDLTNRVNILYSFRVTSTKEEL